MKHRWSVVFVHHNNPSALVKSCLVFKERQYDGVRFFLIDNGSGLVRFLAASLIIKKLVRSAAIFRRQNKNREAGGYWYFIDELYDGESMVLFSQDELHQRGMRPKGVGQRFDTKALPYYPEYYGRGGLSLAECGEWLSSAPLDSIGFGGRRCRQSVHSDGRFTTDHWKERWAGMNLDYYDFFSGACFAVAPSGVRNFRKYGQPTKTDLEDPAFAWMWERMWGTIPLFAGGDLVHYGTKDKSRVDALHDRDHNDWDEFTFTKPRYYGSRLGVRKLDAAVGQQ